jgi:hypothetical protein
MEKWQSFPRRAGQGDEARRDKRLLPQGGLC